MPQARHGGSGVLAVAVAGSKLEGTGFEKLHITQTQVAAVAGWNWGCRTRRLDRLDPFAGAASMRLGGLGTSVIFADDLRNPAWEIIISICIGAIGTSVRTYVELKPLNCLQIQGNRVLSGRLLINIADAVRRQIYLAILLLG